jgi:hypothetical protein
MPYCSFKYFAILCLAMVGTLPLQAATHALPGKMISVTSPTYGAQISGQTNTIIFYAPGLTGATATCWHAPDSAHKETAGYEKIIAADLKPGSDHKYAFNFLNADFQHGPIVIKIHAWGKDTTDDCFLQLYNLGGVIWNQGLPPVPPQAKGMKLVFQDDFNAPLSISRSGQGAVYTSVKPDGDTAEFGDGVFASYKGPYDPFLQIDSYVRIRAVKQLDAGFKDPKSWKRTHTTGYLSSLRIDRTGIMATRGYFECRMLAPNAQGTLPGFWLMTVKDTGTGTRTDGIDIMKAYGSSSPVKPPDTYTILSHQWSPVNAPINVTHQVTCNWYQSFHVYGCKIGPDTTVYYVDNKEVWRHATTPLCKTQPLFFMICLPLGEGRPVDLSRYNGSVDMYVDYVRVYEP